MSLFIAIAMGGLGLRFGRLGAGVKASGGGSPPPSETLPHFTIIF